MFTYLRCVLVCSTPAGSAAAVGGNSRTANVGAAVQGHGETVHGSEDMTAWRKMAKACWVTSNEAAAPSVPTLAARLQAHYLTWMLPFEQARTSDSCSGSCLRRCFKFTARVEVLQGCEGRPFHATWRGLLRPR